jgi:hypothetical protein
MVLLLAGSTKRDQSKAIAAAKVRLSEYRQRINENEKDE